ncbi:beta-ketoacyl synthase chain length factor [Dyadobacter chenwenxiniae]|uniref:Beta-ketoacyl synthase chain length factor n=1 Tax=Dyadobacter chenwenxiniae TaxID=2906456 RepID=A0A9X1PL69_9BACT|nr:beta-ketoacyl synthase chain length factor [Dyadobacter chenwenxiniae]MCF0062254.1 beta-ketoacyl synthase chain length factor [Dyadobacter chenwenxiniae]UON83990.1 beta-ketoacyl synthase chain length factor [Dyadobacter chenwenxiniae]
MYYISATSTISHQPTFQNVGFSAAIQPVQASSALLSPDYKEFIDAGLLRRMSKILRMSVACAQDCIRQAEIEQPGAIIVGTGLGCLLDTEKFLNNVITIKGMLPPTSFIQSTHNTMAGQISLSIGNHGYNMTHTQNTVSFENAMLDAMLLLDEKEENILVGAADEAIDFLNEISDKLHLHLHLPLTSGASFFILSNQKNDRSLAHVKDTRTFGLVDDAGGLIRAFLTENQVNVRDLDLVLFPGISKDSSGVTNLFANLGLDKGKCADYLCFSGIYPTTSAFALHLAVDKMKADKSLKNVLICNTLIQSNLGLTLLQSVEA